MKKTLLFLAVVLMGLSMMAQSTYTMIASESELNAGDKVILVGFDNDGNAFVMSYQKSNNRHAVAIDVNGGTITTTVATDPASQTEPFELTIGGSTGAWTFFDELNNGYLYAPGGGNYLKTQSTLDDKGQWTLSMDGDGFVPTSNGGAEQNIMRYNVTSTLFGCYKSSSNVNGLIYIFKEGGAPVIYPEPSNYPTSLYTLHDMLDITVNWTDAVGAQLPSKYLVLISTGNITVPTDGTPVADGPHAKNVAYGVETVTFANLTPGTYNVAIFPYTNSGENIDYKTDGNYPTTSEQTEMVVCIFESDFANGLEPFMTYDVLGEQTWSTGVYQGIHYANMNGYANSASHANEDWLITPDLVANNSYDLIMVNFMNAYKFDGNAIQVLISDVYDGVSNPNGFVWEDITSYFNWSTGNFEWVTTGAGLNVTGFDHLYIAFKYTSTDAASSNWEIADFKAYVDWDAVSENETASFNLYPNPANDVVRINAEADAMVQIIDMTGRIVMSVNAVEGENSINVADLESGVYFVRMNNAVVKFVKR